VFMAPRLVFRRGALFCAIPIRRRDRLTHVDFDVCRLFGLYAFYDEFVRRGHGYIGENRRNGHRRQPLLFVKCAALLAPFPYGVVARTRIVTGRQPLRV